jgi:HAD superfamily hydrolase (TIGR01490 family)
VSKAIAFFDFDGTITTKDTLLEFIKYSKGSPAFYFGFLLNSPYLVAYKLKIISNQRAKEKVLQYFFKGMTITDFQNLCDRFALERIPTLIRPQAIKEIKELVQKQVKVVIVSASPEYWIKKWSDTIPAQLIATRLDIQQQKLTGKISGINCHGTEKVRRIKENFELNDFDEIYAFGDSSGDKPMLGLAHFAHMKPFRKQLD